MTHSNLQPPTTEEIDGKRDISLAETLDPLKAIETGAATHPPMIEGVRTVELVLAASRMGETGEVVRLG